ncbi:MAG: [FeFe] hydrogenase H-cluster radical SAM maturase HydE [Eubacteriales bacterium]
MSTDYSRKLIDKLKKYHTLTASEFTELLENCNPDIAEYLYEKARQVQSEHYKNHIYIRGLIEYTNYCKNDCYYCGIRASNRNATRYRLDKDTILACCETGYRLGFRTFVLQGGEDPYFTDARMIEIVSAIRNQYPDCAITLSIGEKSYETYEALYQAGANRYLLRHETHNATHYSQLHPSSLTASNRQDCLWNLKKIGYQVGTGFMVGSPYQTTEHLVEDLLFIKELNPQMVGIGPFICHHDTPFAKEKSGDFKLTLFLIGLLRLMIPKLLLPATTALGTIDSMGRELGILAGANVVMPNLSPAKVRENYSLYDNKLCTGDESAELLNELKRRISKIHYEIISDIGDSKNM